MIKKMISGVLLIAVILTGLVALPGCGTAEESALVGRWTWNQDSSFVYNFEEDGTGSRGRNEPYQPFTWTAEDGILTMSAEVGQANDDRSEERWNYSVDGDTLALVDRRNPQASYEYNRVGDEDEQAGGEAVVVPPIVGRWARELEAGTITYTFNADGTGNVATGSGIPVFRWTAEDGTLTFDGGGEDDTESVQYSIEGNVLTMTDSEGVARTYNRVED